MKNLTLHPNNGGTPTLQTDANGVISGSFIVPNNDIIKIKTGTRQFKILDISVDNEQNAGVISSAPYTASGYLDTKQAEYSSTRFVYRPYFYFPSNYSNDDGPDIIPTTGGNTKAQIRTVTNATYNALQLVPNTSITHLSNVPRDNGLDHHTQDVDNPDQGVSNENYNPSENLDF